jgi:hypothetical protein
MLNKFVTLNLGDVNTNRIQLNIEKVLNPVLVNPILDYNIVNSVRLIAGDNLVDHKLGRKPLGWYLVRKRGPAEIYDKQDSNPSANLNYLLNSDAIVDVDIYFF